jgi:hypothetical protein
MLIGSTLPLAGVLALGAAPAGAAPTCPCSLWSDSTTPVTVDSGENLATELGVQFSSATGGYLSGVRFYKAAANTGIHIGSLWAADGTLLAQATFTNETGSGWQQVTFATPVQINANTTYIASYHTNSGHYSVDPTYFSSSSYTNGPLTAPGGDPTQPNGLFAYSATPTFPTGTFNGNNYWVDVVYSPTAPAPVPPAAATSLWGNSVPGVVDWGDSQAVEVGVQFSSANAGYLSGVRFYKSAANTGAHVGSLWTASGTLLAQATFTNETGSGWQQVTFATPVQIAANTTYIASYHTNTGHYAADSQYFSSGSYTNAPLTAPGGDPAHPNGLFTYSATPTFPTGTFNGANYWVDVMYSPTAPPPVTPPTISTLWGPNTTPAVVDSGDPAATEVGVQFSSSKAGWVSSLRFYKAAANTGTHIGSIWSATGTLLAQATFTAESASGWQQVNFATPVKVVANTPYVASYHTDAGHFSVDPGYFASSGYSNPPLSAPAGDATHPNGMFAYSATPTFPAGTYNGNNYWVDVVFNATPYPVALQASTVQTTLPKGTSEAAKVTATLSDGTTVDVTSKVTWTSSTPTVATVSAAGQISALAPGTTTLTASYSGLTATIGLTVVAPIVAIAITPQLAIVDNGPVQLTATARLSDGSHVVVTGLTTWAIPLTTPGLTVSAKGVVTATKPAIGIITATLGSASDCALAVRIKP